MQPPQEPRDGNAAPWSRLCRWAERVLEGRRIGPGAARARDQKRAMTMPPPFIPSGSRHGAAEMFEEAIKEAPREAGTRVTVGCRREPSARQIMMGGLPPYIQEMLAGAQHPCDSRPASMGSA
jgi:hypothetical protein